MEQAQATYQALVKETHDFEASQVAARRILELQSERLAVEIQMARQNLDHLTIRAPIGGLLVSQQIFRGSEFGEIRNGDQLRPGQPYLRIVDLRSMKVEARVNQADAAELRLAAPVHIRFDAYPGLTLTGRVQTIGAIARNSGWRAAYVAEIPIEIQINESDPRVIPSLTVSADLVQAKVNASAIVPLQAVFRERSGDVACTYVQTAGGWERREVELDQVNNTEASIRSGLSQGERVALEEPAQWTDSTINASARTD